MLPTRDDRAEQGAWSRLGQERPATGPVSTRSMGSARPGAGGGPRPGRTSSGDRRSRTAAAGADPGPSAASRRRLGDRERRAVRSATIPTQIGTRPSAGGAAMRSPNRVTECRVTSVVAGPPGPRRRPRGGTPRNALARHRNEGTQPIADAAIQLSRVAASDICSAEVAATSGGMADARKLNAAVCELTTCRPRGGRTQAASSSRTPPGTTATAPGRPRPAARRRRGRAGPCSSTPRSRRPSRAPAPRPPARPSPDRASGATR